MQTLVHEWSARTKIKAEVHCVLEPRLTSALENTIYRITQEALTNIARHSGAKNASIILERRDARALLIIEDDGQGFPETPSAKRNGDSKLGLVGISERVNLLGGTLDIESTEHGTTLFVRLPLETATGTT